MQNLSSSVARTVALDWTQAANSFQSRLHISHVSSQYKRWWQHPVCKLT